MDTVRQLEQRREDLFAQMRSIRSMRRGTVNEQYLKVRRKGRAEPGRCGPYYVLTRKQGGRTVSQRLTDPQQVAQARADVAAHKRFVELCREYKRVTEQLGQVDRAAGGDPKKKRPS
jgi:hypothetical protein